MSEKRYRYAPKNSEVRDAIFNDRHEEINGKRGMGGLVAQTRQISSSFAKQAAIDSKLFAQQLLDNQRKAIISLVITLGVPFITFEALRFGVNINNALHKKIQTFNADQIQKKNDPNGVINTGRKAWIVAQNTKANPGDTFVYNFMNLWDDNVLGWSLRRLVLCFILYHLPMKYIIKIVRYFLQKGKYKENESVYRSAVQKFCHDSNLPDIVGAFLSDSKLLIYALNELELELKKSDNQNRFLTKKIDMIIGTIYFENLNDKNYDKLEETLGEFSTNELEVLKRLQELSARRLKNAKPKEEILEYIKDIA